jgi:hypothetical protein
VAVRVTAEVTGKHRRIAAQLPVISPENAKCYVCLSVDRGMFRHI